MNQPPTTLRRPMTYTGLVHVCELAPNGYWYAWCGPQASTWEDVLGELEATCTRCCVMLRNAKRLNKPKPFPTHQPLDLSPSPE